MVPVIVFAIVALLLGKLMGPSLHWFESILTIGGAAIAALIAWVKLR